MIIAIAVYGGYFGTGIGVLFFAALGVFVDGTAPRLNATKQMLALVCNGVAGVLFAFVAPVYWTAAAVLAVGSAAGGPIGARLSRRISAPALRAVVCTVGAAAAVYLAVKQWCSDGLVRVVAAGQNTTTERDSCDRLHSHAEDHAQELVGAQIAPAGQCSGHHARSRLHYRHPGAERHHPTDINQSSPGVYQGTDAVVRSTVTLDNPNGGPATRAEVAPVLERVVAATPGVERALGGTTGYAQLIGHDGKAIGDPAGARPTLG